MKRTNALVKDAQHLASDAIGRMADALRMIDQNSFDAAGSVLQIAKSRLQAGVASINAALRDLKEEMANVEPSTPLLDWGRELTERMREAGHDATVEVVEPGRRKAKDRGAASA